MGTLYLVASSCPHYHFLNMATLEVLVYFAGDDSNVNIMRRCCRIEPLCTTRRYKAGCRHSIISPKLCTRMCQSPYRSIFSVRSEEHASPNLVLRRTPMPCSALKCVGMRWNARCRTMSPCYKANDMKYVSMPFFILSSTEDDSGSNVAR